MACLTPEQIEMHARGEIEADEAEELQTHVEGCDACRTKLAECLANEQHLRELKEDLGSDGPGEPARIVPTEPKGGSEVGRRIGSYKVVEVLGRGGMGVVYLARQDQPRRTVALKVIRPGIAGVQVLKRFEHEAQILGRLQHSGIAQIFEAGTADSGSGPQPCFAMELVRGVPLNKYAEVNRLGTRARLELFVKICDAVQHAHQKGVIHRDLKPGNILVTEEGQPKVLDFGVARATDSDIQTTTLRTDIGQLIGTVPYMSPEQVSGDPEELDTRSDVYALEVIAYELLAGCLPYDLQKKMIHEAARIIREEVPTPLSSRNRALRGDVETIVSKALEKSRSRRYQSASDLAGDVRRYLSDETIEARPPSVTYQFRKFAARNKTLVGGVTAVFVVLLLGVIGTSWGLFEAREQRDAAVAARDAEARMRAESERETEKARRIQGFMEQIFRSQTKRSEIGRELTFKEMLSEVEGHIASEFADYPRSEARIRTIMGDSYQLIGDFDSAERHFQLALNLQRQIDLEARSRTAEGLERLGLVLYYKGSHTDAEQIFRKVIELRNELGCQNRSVHIGAHENLAWCLHDQSRFREATQVFRAILQMASGEELDGASLKAAARRGLGACLFYQGDYAGAELAFRQSLLSEHAPNREEHLGATGASYGLGDLLAATGRYAEAESIVLEAHAMDRARLGPEHPLNERGMVTLASLHFAIAKTTAGVDLVRQVMDSRIRQLEADHPLTVGNRREKWTHIGEQKGPTWVSRLSTLRKAARVSSLGSVRRTSSRSRRLFSFCFFFFL